MNDTLEPQESRCLFKVVQFGACWEVLSSSYTMIFNAITMGGELYINNNKTISRLKYSFICGKLGLNPFDKDLFSLKCIILN